MASHLSKFITYLNSSLNMQKVWTLSFNSGKNLVFLIEVTEFSVCLEVLVRSDSKKDCENDVGDSGEGRMEPQIKALK